MIRALFAMLYKELLAEWREPARASGIFFFALTLVLLVGIAAPSNRSFTEFAAATLWLGLTLASTRSLDQSYAAELEHDAIEGLVLWPVDPRAVFYGKALANTLMLFVVCLALTPIVLAMSDASIDGSVPRFFGFLVLGCAGLAAPGTLFGLLAARARGSSVLLPLLLIPLLVPMLLAGARGTMLVMEGGPAAEKEAPGWMMALLVFNALHWSVGGLFYSVVLDDG